MRGWMMFVLALLLAAPIGCAENRTRADMLDPDIRGVVTHVERSAIRVEAEPGEAAGSPKAQVQLTPETLIRDVDGHVTDFNALQLGQIVEIWFEGGVMESYPVQATAREIVIEQAVPADPAGAEGQQP